MIMSCVKYVLLLVTSVSFYLAADEVKLVPTTAGMYDVGGFSLYLECYENDKPKLILEQGFGNSGSDGVWLENVARLRNDFSICLYDRAGLGKSEKGPVPFTVNDIATRLHNLLMAADVTPPYYFAGGSYAYYVIRSYNNLYPDNVLGVTLIAPPPFGYFHTMGNRWPVNFKADSEQLEKYMAFDLSVHNPLIENVPENVDHMESYKQLTRTSDFGDKPTIILRSKASEKRYDPPFVPDHIAIEMDKLFDNAEAHFKSLSTNSRVVYSKSERHHLHIFDRDLVVNSIRSLLED